MAAAFLLAALLVAIAAVSLRYQVRNWRRLRSEALASDDRRYLRGLAQRRTITAVFMLILAGMLAGAYLSGGQQELNRIAGLPFQDPPGERTPEDDQFVKTWAIYWIVFLVLLFVVVMVAVADYTATSLYARQQLKRIRNEQRTLLERDLAVYRQQKLNDRAKRLEGS
jgi:amino acid transporter